MRNWVRTLLFLSAFSPCLVTIALSRIWDRGLTWDSAYYLFFGLLGILTVRYVVDAIRWHSESFPFIAKKIEANDALMLGVVATYFIPFIGRASDLTVGTVLLIVAGLFSVLWMSTSILPSPVMRILGYRFYKAESEHGVVYTLITQRDLLDPRAVTQVKKISNSMLVEV